MLTAKQVENAKGKDDRYELPDGTGLYLVVQPSGVRTWAFRYRFQGKPRKQTLGPYPLIPLADKRDEKGRVLVKGARTLAAQAREAVEAGKDPASEKASEGLTVSDLLDDFIDRYCIKEKGLKSVDQYKDTFERLVKPDIGDLPVIGEGRVRRSNIVDMLDEIEDESGPVMADRTLAYVRKAFNWFAARNEEFTNPIVKGLRQISTNSRNRILSDDELRDLWEALGKVQNVPICYPRFVKMLLLTTTRRNEAAQIHSSEIDGTDWTIPAHRYKTKLDHLIPLSDAARDLIDEKPKAAKGNSWFIFSTTCGEKGFSGFSKAKRELDKAIAEIRKRDERDPMPGWVLHDLRRTGRSLMSKAGVPSDHAERCLGHVIGGVRGVYDRYEYLDEKRQAFEKLAGLVALILNPQSNVTPLRA